MRFYIRAINPKREKHIGFCIRKIFKIHTKNPKVLLRVIFFAFYIKTFHYHKNIVFLSSAYLIFIVAFSFLFYHNEYMVRKDKAFATIVVLEVIAVIFVSFGIWLAYTNVNIETTYYDVESDLIPAEFDGFKIAHISDLHDRDWKGALESLVESEKPDIIVITGDIVDPSNRYYDNSLTFIKNAVTIAPVYFISGNHEAYMTDYVFMKNAIKEYGATVLEDENVFIERGGEKINLIGLKDPDFAENVEYYSYNHILKTAINSMTRTDVFNIVLSHRPEYFEGYSETDANLVLCGHAHGGQVRLPSGEGLIAPGQGFFPKYTEGMHSKDNTAMIISRGLGDSVIPIRINNMPELVIITLKSLQ